MFPAAGWYHSNQYNAQAACEHCGGITRHENWCLSRNSMVQYAFRAVRETEKLTLRDRLSLHALGVCWVLNGGEHACEQSTPGEPRPLPSEP
jgi:hypothetical protein